MITGGDTMNNHEACTFESITRMGGWWAEMDRLEPDDDDD